VLHCFPFRHQEAVGSPAWVNRKPMSRRSWHNQSETCTRTAHSVVRAQSWYELSVDPRVGKDIRLCLFTLTALEHEMASHAWKVRMQMRMLSANAKCVSERVCVLFVIIDFHAAHNIAHCSVCTSNLVFAHCFVRVSREASTPPPMG